MLTTKESSTTFSDKAELELGCGLTKRPKAIGLDMNPGVNPDILFEVQSRESLPFQDNRFDKIWMIDFIEHVPDIMWVLSEVHRVSKPDAIVEMRYPHYTSIYACNDVTHIHRLGIHAFDHFDPSKYLGAKYKYYKNFGRNFPFNIIGTTIEFSGNPFPKISSGIHRFIGSSKYENSVSRFLPIGNIEMKLKVVK